MPRPGKIKLAPTHKVTALSTEGVLGLAASAASVIAMAGDEIQIGASSFLMIHNAWVLAIGNRNDLREVADFLEPFDRALADVYVARAGQDLAVVQSAMDAETWFNGSQAVELGYADSLLAADEVAFDLINKIKGTSDSPRDGKSDSAELNEGLTQLLGTIRG
jgi:ATP-dependent protease ClpP protease subunit